MPIFTQKTSSIPKALKAIVNRAKELQLDTAAWSLAELHLDEADFDWLCEWAKNLEVATARQWLCPQLSKDATTANEELHYRKAIGTILLLFAAEYARRCLPRYGDWLIPIHYIYQAETAALLFSYNQPSLVYQSALHLAIKRLGLRTMPAWDSPPERQEQSIELFRAEQFNQTLALQYGFTAAAVDCGLTKWVMEKEPSLEICFLLDKQKGSQSFRKAWSASRAYQRGIITSNSLKQALEDNPWILTSWIEPIMSNLPPATPYIPPPTPVSPPSPLALASVTPAEYAQASSSVSLPLAPVPYSKATRGRVTLQDLFVGFTPFGGVKTIMKGVRAILTRAQEESLLHQHWSLAELCLTDYDYIWLRTWVKRLEPWAILACQKGGKSFRVHKGDAVSVENPALTWQAGLGLLLLLWMTETARREAVEGELWPYLVEGYFTPVVNEMLFTRGYSSALLREMLWAASKQLPLRNVLDEPNVQRWMDTTFLQFGFTQRGFRQRLPEWLAGQATTRAVTALLDEQTGSASFRNLWDELRAYRRGQVAKEQLIRTLADCPWVLPEWTEELIARATASTGVIEAEAPPLPNAFLTAPVLHWPFAGTPQFVCQIPPDLTHLNLTDSSYDVCFGGTVQAQLLRQADNTYLPVPSRFITIAFDQPTATASLSDAAGTTVHECELELWPPGEDVVVYRFPSGARLSDAFTQTLSGAVSYGLLLADDLTIEPAPSEWQHFASSQMILYRLNAGWAAVTQVLLDGEVLWEPTPLKAVAIPNWAKSENVGIFLHDTQLVKWGQEFYAKIIHHPEVKVFQVRCQGHATEIKPLDAATTRIGPLMITTDMNARSLELRLGLECEGQRCTVRRSLNPNVIGAKHLHKGVWRVLNKHSVLTVAQAKQDLFGIRLPEQWRGELLNANELTLLEGDSLSHRRPAATGSLGTLTGWGAPLRLRPLFNALPTSFSLNLAGSVVDHGLLTSAVCDVSQDGQARLLRLSFRQPVEPGEHHSVVWWDVNGQVILLSPKYWDEAEGAWWWVCDLPEECVRPLAIATAYQGERQGAWWEDGIWLQPLTSLAEQEAPRSAALLHWFHLPLLSAEAKLALHLLVENQPVACLRAWLLNEGLPEELKVSAKSESWLAVVYSLFCDWQPTAEQAHQTLLTLAKVETEKEFCEYLPDAFHLLNQVDPLLMAKVLQQWQAPQKGQLIQKLRLDLAECKTTAELSLSENNLLNKAACDLNKDAFFINNGIVNRAVQLLNGVPIDETAKRNLAVAARIEDLRRLLALRLLAQI